MAVTLDQIGDAVLVAIRDDATIYSTCFNFFGKAHAVFLNAPDRLTPDPQFMPLFSVLCVEKDNTENSNTKDYGIILGVTIQDNAKTELSVSGIYTLKYLGQKNVETLADLGLAAIRAMSSSITLSASTLEILYADGDIWSARYSLTISIPVLLGAEVSL